jgi:hypothetical protein
MLVRTREKFSSPHHFLTTKISVFTMHSDSKILEKQFVPKPNNGANLYSQNRNTP